MIFGAKIGCFLQTAKGYYKKVAKPLVISQKIYTFASDLFNQPHY